MANEKNVQAENAAEKEKRLTVVRETFNTKDGRKLWGYYVYGNVMGREMKVEFEAADVGGYEVLDLIFMFKPTGELAVYDESFRDRDTGEVNEHTVYEIVNVDSEGDELACRVKPQRRSDKSVLDYLIKKLNRKTAAGDEAAE